MAGGFEAPVLVLTDVIDPTADLVVAELEGRGVPVMRCNPGDFPQKLTLVARLDGESLSGRLVYADRRTGRRDEVALGDIGCGYYRRPSAFRLGEHVPDQWWWTGGPAMPATRTALSACSLIGVPEGLRAVVNDLMYCSRLRFAALDFGVTHDGELVFFEINPNGQWAWLQERVGLDIAHTIADALTSEDRLVPTASAAGL